MQELEIRELLPEINPEFSFKVVILGDSGVGKTSLIKYEIQNSFIINNESTMIFEHFCKNFSIMGRNVRLQIWDTCGKEMYRMSAQNFYRSALCIFVVFSLESLDSFNKVNQWIEEIKENNCEEYILVLVGNKSDLTPTRKIEKEVIEQYCKNNGIENYFEVSAKSGENIHELFKSVVRQLFIKFALPIINDNRDIQNNERELPFDKKFFNQNTLGCYKSCCYNQ